MVWPYPDDLRKAHFILRDEKEVQLWDIFGGRGLAMESNLAQTRARLEEALEWVKVVHQAVTVDLPRVIEVSFLHSSLTPWYFVGCLSMLASHFAGSGGDVEPQVPFPPGRACSDGAGGYGVAAESSIAS